MSPETVELVERHIDAFNRRDVAAFAELATDDFEWSPSMVAIEGEVFRGRAGIDEYFARMIDAWEEFRILDVETRDLGDRVLVSCLLEGQGRSSRARVSAPLDILYDVRDAKVARMRSFLDHEEALRAVATGEQSHGS